MPAPQVYKKKEMIFFFLTEITFYLPVADTNPFKSKWNEWRRFIKTSKNNELAGLPATGKIDNNNQMLVLRFYMEKKLFKKNHYETPAKPRTNLLENRNIQHFWQI